MLSNHNSYNKPGITLPEGIIDNTNPQQIGDNIQHATEYINSDEFGVRLYNDAYTGDKLYIELGTSPELLSLGGKMDSLRGLSISLMEIQSMISERINTFNNYANQIKEALNLDIKLKNSFL